MVAVASLFVAWDEARSVRRQQAASVLPILRIAAPYMDGKAERYLRIEVENVGIGPAFVDRAEVLWDGVPVKTTEDLKHNVLDEAPGAEFWTNGIDGVVLGGGERLLLYEASWKPGTKGAAEEARAVASAIRSRAEVRACYCSVYDRCWRTKIGQRGRPDRVRDCRSAF